MRRRVRWKIDEQLHLVEACSRAMGSFFNASISKPSGSQLAAAIYRYYMALRGDSETLRTKRSLYLKLVEMLSLYDQMRTFSEQQETHAGSTWFDTAPCNRPELRVRVLGSRYRRVCGGLEKDLFDVLHRLAETYPVMVSQISADLRQGRKGAGNDGGLADVLHHHAGRQHHRTRSSTADSNGAPTVGWTGNGVNWTTQELETLARVYVKQRRGTTTTWRGLRTKFIQNGGRFIAASAVIYAARCMIDACKFIKDNCVGLNKQAGRQVSWFDLPEARQYELACSLGDSDRCMVMCVSRCIFELLHCQTSTPTTPTNSIQTTPAGSKPPVVCGEVETGDTSEAHSEQEATHDEQTVSGNEQEDEMPGESLMEYALRATQVRAREVQSLTVTPSLYLAEMIDETLAQMARESGGRKRTDRNALFKQLLQQQAIKARQQVELITMQREQEVQLVLQLLKNDTSPADQQ